MTFFSSLYESSAMLANLLGKKRKFMNLGFEPVDRVQTYDQADAHHITLYKKLIDLKDYTPGSALEIGCGRGGGCHVLKNYYGAIDITAVDLSSSNIKLAKKLVPGVNFIVASATDFYVDKKFDLIVNLESSHRYSSREEFFRKVSSMMHPGSCFVFGDTILKSKKESVEEMMKTSGLNIIKTEIVNAGVVASIKKNSPKQYPLVTKLPFLFSRDLHNFFTTIHSGLYRKLQNEEILYVLYLLKKQ